MSEFGDLLREALVGDEEFDPSPGREALEAAVVGYERRLRTIRFMAMFAVLFMGAVSAVSLVFLLRAPEGTGLRTLLIYALGFFFGMSGIGMSKLWFAMMMNQSAVLKEIKRVQLALLDR